MDVRAFTVCVDFDDILRETIESNAKHFSEWWIITSSADDKTISLVNDAKRSFGHLGVFVTDVFYADGADFNKGAAIEECLSFIGKRGWIASVDADILLPRQIPFDGMRIGNLYSAKRRMLYDVARVSLYRDQKKWKNLSVKRDFEHAGYFTVWHAEDPAIAGKEWFCTQFKNASGYDSAMCMRWPVENRLWMPIEVLHIGFDCQNWCGRATPLVDGTMPQEAGSRRDRLRQTLLNRRSHGFSMERIDGQRDL